MLQTAAMKLKLLPGRKSIPYLESEVAQSCLTLCNSMDCSLPGSSVHGILQANTGWSGLAFPSPEYLPNPGIEPGSPALQADSLPSEPPGRPNIDNKSVQICRKSHVWQL